MKRVAHVPLVVLAAAVLAGCTSTPGQQATGTPPTGENRPPSSTSPPASPAPQSTASSDPTEEEVGDPPVHDIQPVEPAEDPELRFGQSFSYEDGLPVTVGKPQPFRPSETAAFDRAPAYRSFTVTIVNKTGRRFDPATFTTTVQSSNEEAEAVYDTARGIEGSPSTTLLNGRETKFRIAYGLQDPKDVVMEVNPSFDHEAVVYTTG